MSELERLQAEFQRSILGQDSAVLEHVMDGPREQRDVLFGVYKNGYASRLTEVLRKDHEYLHAYLGDEMFDQMSKLYIAEHPSQQPNLRWFSRELPDLLRTAPPFAEYPEIADLAALERDLNDCFDAPDAPVLAAADFAGIAAERWTDLRFVPHPSARRLDLSTNAADIWLALKSDEAPPDAVRLGSACRLLIWRQDVTPRFRELTDEEAMMWDEAARGRPFGVLCSMLAVHDDPDGAAGRAAGYLQQWVTTDLLAGLS